MGSVIPVTPAERKRIVALLREGKSYRTIRKTIRRANATISKIAQEEGIDFDARSKAQVAKATEARKAFSAEWRAAFCERLAADIERMRCQFSEPTVISNFGGRDNVYNEHEVSEPPIESKRHLSFSIAQLMKTMLEVDRHDNRVSDTSAVEMWLDALKRDPR